MRQARRALGRETVQFVLEQARHHHDDRGRPWWLADELVEAVELVEVERTRMGVE